MLDSIHIENVALIKNLDIELSNGFSAFTGETGAGKSIIIDSIGCLCGNKTPKELIRKGEEQAVVEGIFSSLGESALQRCASLGVGPDEDGVLYVSRTVKNDGKSIVKINGKTVPLSLLREISPSLINIHGQHDNTELLNKDSHRKLLDCYGELSAELDEYLRAYNKYCSIKRQLDAKNSDEGEKLRRIEMLKFQINDISSMKLKSGEEEKLTDEKKRLLNMEKIATNSNIVCESLTGSGATELIDRALDALRALSKISDDYVQYEDILIEAKSKLCDVAETVSDMCGDDTANPAVLLDRIESRLDEISKAKRKYAPDIEGILSYLEKAKQELDDIENFDKKSEQLREELSIAGKELKA
ncbi:MAG: AAA family ATPase, partial [Clostridia bacterium]|nr:AAA family ATPase [Clostridia bacterium]